MEHIKAVMPGRIIHSPTKPALATTQLLSAIEELQCPICLDVLQQAMQLPCDRFVCATCLIEWVHLASAHCPCCYTTSPLECALIKPAPRMVQLLLHDVMVVCPSCKRSIKAIEYDAHCCSEVSKQEMQLVSTVVHRMLDATQDQCIRIPTGGKVSYMFKVNSFMVFHSISNYSP